ncbi:MAG: hypothetical protein RAO92_10565 [Candidatus Euphemobacter frigidus]|nr:hypothetical protein [Candidatus Euphemobacter frigidus]MDP8276827.1 hypothetical protein [Candidatus Euphemobacter frigidus]
MNVLKKFFYVGEATGLPKMLIGFCVLFLVLSAESCSRAPEDPAWFQSTTSGDTLSSNQLTKKINQEDSLFNLYDMKREYILRGGESREVMVALDKRRDQLTEAAEIFPAIPEKLNFLGWDIDKVDGNKYRISCYFVVVGKMDRDWIFKLLAKVDEKHVPMLAPENQKSRRVKWQVYPKTSTWDPGEHKIISEIVELQPIPYFICARMFLYPEFIHHGVFNYGWFADPDLTTDLPPEE